MSIIQRFATENYVAEKIEEVEVPVQSINGKTGNVTLDADDVGADASGAAISAVSDHNTSASAHADIREAINAITPENIGAAPSSHTQAASTISAGTFAGEVIANASAQTPATSLLRNSKLVTSETTPSNNGEICWMYE